MLTTKPPSQKSIAEELGLSTAAVSNILKGKGRFAEKTRKQVLKKLEDAGYEPRYRYRPIIYLGLQTNSTDAWHVLKYFSIINGIRNLLHEERMEWRMDFIPGFNKESSLTNDKLEYLLESILSIYQPSGFIIDTEIYFAFKISNYFARKKIPSVLIGHEIESDGVSGVMVDSFGGACDAVSHFVKEGHRRIGMIRWNSTNIANSAKKFAGYQCALAENNIEFDANLVIEAKASRRDLSNSKQRIGREALISLLEKNKSNLPSAIFVENSFISDSLIYPLCEDAGKMPSFVENIKFIHYEDSPLSIQSMVMHGQLNYTCSSCRVCRIDWEQMAELAGEQIIKLIRQNTENIGVIKIKPIVQDLG